MEYNWDLDQILILEKFDEFCKNFQIKLNLFSNELKNMAFPLTEKSYKDLINKYIELSELINIIYARAYLAEEKNSVGEEEKFLKSKANNILMEFSDSTRPFIHLLKGLQINDGYILSDKEIQALLKISPNLSFYIKKLRKLNKHTLTIKEEEIISNKDINGIQSLLDLRAIIESDQKFEVLINGKKKIFETTSDISKYFKDKNPQNRINSYNALYDVYKSNSHKYFTIYQSIAKDWTYEAKLRKYNSNISIRNLSNDIDDETVDTLLNICKENKNIFNKFFKLKQKELGLKEMIRYDIYAPIGAKEKKISYDEATKLILSVLKEFDDEIYSMANKLFSKRNIDVFPIKNKRSGAFCANITNKIDPFLLLNYTDSIRDVFVVAHELGHAIHYMYSQEQSVLTQDAPLTLAETASTFTENIVFDYLYKIETNKEIKKSLLFDKISDAYATILRQAYFVLFEKEAHSVLANGIKLDDFNNLYLENLKNQFDGYVSVPEVFKYEWAYIPHIVNSPFYCYAYPFGNLLAFSLYESYLENGPKLLNSYKNILKSGGSTDPYELLLKEGFDLKNPDFFNKGFRLISKWVEELEELIKE